MSVFGNGVEWHKFVSTQVKFICSLCCRPDFFLQRPELFSITDKYFLAFANGLGGFNKTTLTVDQIFGIIAQALNPYESLRIVGKPPGCIFRGQGVDGSRPVKPEQVAIVSILVLHVVPRLMTSLVFYNAVSLPNVYTCEQSFACIWQTGLPNEKVFSGNVHLEKSSIFKTYLNSALT
jgi:hypothetical protein